MTFTLTIRTDYVDIEFFYPHSGWDEEYEGWKEDEDEVAFRELIEKCISVCPRNEDEIEQLMDEIYDFIHKGVSSPGRGGGQYANGELEVATGGEVRFIDDPFPGNGFDDDEIEELYADKINSKFCFLKMWKNSGTFKYEDDGDFDENLLSFSDGHMTYDGNPFELVDGDGCDSETRFYKDGELVA